MCFVSADKAHTWWPGDSPLPYAAGGASRGMAKVCGNHADVRAPVVIKQDVHKPTFYDSEEAEGVTHTLPFTPETDCTWQSVHGSPMQWCCSRLHQAASVFS